MTCSANILLAVIEGKNKENKENVINIPKNMNRYILNISLWSLNNSIISNFFSLAAWFSSIDISLFKEGSISKEVKAIEANPGLSGNNNKADPIPIKEYINPIKNAYLDFFSIQLAE